MLLALARILLEIEERLGDATHASDRLGLPLAQEVAIASVEDRAHPAALAHDHAVLLLLTAHEGQERRARSSSAFGLETLEVEDGRREVDVPHALR